MTEPARRVYIISDLHIGGAYADPGDTNQRGFRISTRVPKLTAFVSALAGKAIDGPQTELVINGDFIDFLAEADGGANEWTPFTLSADAATAKLEDIVERDRALFDALSEFVERGHRLTILLGNHDLELAVPQVRRRLLELMSVRGSHDFQFIYDGEAYVIGDVLIEHGNRYDMWNVVDHDALRRYRSLASRNQHIPREQEFVAPAGSHMVSSVINPVKSNYPFIDLLKPEVGAALPILLALEPGTRNRLGAVARLTAGATKHRLAAPAMPGFGGDISADNDPAASFGGDIGSFDSGLAAAAPAPTANGDPLAVALADSMGSDAEAFLSELEQDSAIGEDISSGDWFDQKLGLANLLLTRNDADVERRLPSLLKALRALQSDTSFDRSIEAGTDYLEAAQKLAEGGFRCIVFGHTHLPKRVTLDGGAVYLNTGTWADVMRFPTDIVSGTSAEAMPRLREFVDDIGSGNFDRWIGFNGTYARLDLDGDDRLLDAALCDYDDQSMI